MSHYRECGSCSKAARDDYEVIDASCEGKCDMCGAFAKLYDLSMRPKSSGSFVTPIGRRVRDPWHRVEGVIVKWEPLGCAMNDTLLKYDDGRECWHSMSGLKALDGLGALPNRREEQEAARLKAVADLIVIRDNHWHQIRKPWPYMEFVKVWTDTMLYNALKGSMTEDEWQAYDERMRHKARAIKGVV